MGIAIVLVHLHLTSGWRVGVDKLRGVLLVCLFICGFKVRSSCPVLVV
jgi:hypothetical protein